MILLTDEEIEEIISPMLMVSPATIAKAQLKKVVEEGEKECTEHHAAYTPKHQCIQCMISMWQALKKECE